MPSLLKPHQSPIGLEWCKLAHQSPRQSGVLQARYSAVIEAGISPYYLADEVRRVYEGMMIAIPPSVDDVAVHSLRSRKF
ncbi:MAG: hypothetical protein HC769_30760 [Cyanobacteria bacterium CRU_2_1]|nr:hypothetical protein [Cyanobacteria bacterium CRU_2_1]